MKKRSLNSILSFPGLTGESRSIFFILFLVLALFSSGLIKSQAESESANISIDLKSVDIIELLRILSLKTGRTIVPSKSLSGRITIFLNNVSFDDVLDIILLSQGLACHKSGEIIYVLTNPEYKAIHGKDYLEARKMSTVRLNYAKPAGIFNAISQLKSEIGKIIVDEASGTIILMDIPEKLELLEKTITELDHPLETAIYDLNYAKPADAKTTLSAAITPGTGEVIIDERSGKAIISDLPKKMERLEAIVQTLDEEARQVFVEAEIVQVTLSDKYQRGIDWEKVFGEGVDTLDFVGYFPVSPALAAYQKISVGTLSENRYKSVVNLLDTFGDTEVLSQPKLAIVNKEEASIMVGSREAYVTQTSSQSTSTTVTSESVEFIDVGIKLKVSPTINNDGFISMKIKPEVSSVRETITTSLGSRIPIVQTSEAETTVKIKDGVTIMLGGMVEDRYSDSVEGIPGLSRLPVLGNLFGRRAKETKKTELIIFITPHLIRGDAPRPGTELEKFIPEGIKKTLALEEARTKKAEARIEAGKNNQEQMREAKNKKEIERQEAQERKELEKQELKNKREIERQESKKIKELGKKQAESKEAVEKKCLSSMKNMSLPGLTGQSSSLDSLPAGRQAAFRGNDTLQNKEKKEIKKDILPLESPPEEFKNPYKSRSGLLAFQAEIHYKEGLSLQVAGNWQEAKVLYHKVILLDNRYAPAYNQLGIICEEEDLLDQAKAYYLKAVEADPKFASAYSNLALLAEAESDFEKAAEYWQKRSKLRIKNGPWLKLAKKRLKEIKSSHNSPPLAGGDRIYVTIH